MKNNLINYLCCPINRDDLKLLTTISNEDNEILEGKLISSNGTEYKIENGIPNLIPRNSIFGNNNDSQNVYKTVSDSYISILHRIGIFGEKIAQMDSLRFSIYSKTKIIFDKYLRGNVLEVGAGENYLKDEYKLIYEDWISLDFDMRSKSIDIRGDGQQLPFKSEMFDTIVSIDVLEHVPNPEKFVSEMFRVIKPNGHIILSTPFFFHMHEEPNDFFRFSKYGLKVLFERNGFSVLEVLPTAGFVSTIGILISVFITRTFRFSKLLLKILLRINRFVQLKLFLPIDNKLDKNKRFAQGHFIIAKKKTSISIQTPFNV